MTIFEKVKSSVTPKDVARQYGLQANRSNMICCPFHDDKHPSMKLNDDYFYCFGCSAHGDVIDFVSALFEIPPIDAVQKLTEDFGIDMCTNIDKAPAKPKYPRIKEFRENELYCFRVLCDYLHILEEWKIKHAPKAPSNEIDDRFTEACQMLDYIEYLVDILTVGELDVRVTAVKELLADSKIQDLESRILRIREEEEKHERN